MKKSLITLTLMAALALAMGSYADVLSRFRWEYRVLVVFAKADNVESIRAQLDSIEAGVLDRHIRWFLVDGDYVLTNYGGDLTQDFSVQLTRQLSNKDKGDLEVVLVGKDGGVKYRAATLEPDAIFRTIDSMPMRQAEMQRQAGESK